MLTVQGVNLGKEASDLIGGVIVAGVKCLVQEEGYLTTTQFVCITGGSINSMNGTVNITVAGKYTTSSLDTFASKVYGPGDLFQTLIYFEIKISVIMPSELLAQRGHIGFTLSFVVRRRPFTFFSPNHSHYCFNLLVGK